MKDIKEVNEELLQLEWFPEWDLECWAIYDKERRDNNKFDDSKEREDEDEN